MKIIKISPFLVTLIVVLYFALIPQYMGCKKETITKTVTDTTYYDAVCPLRGTYIGSNTPNVGNNSPIVYIFEDNNLAIGKVTPGGASVTFGGYRNNCDSVILSVYYTTTSSYFLLKAKFSNNRNTISGTFNEVSNPSNFGTFTMSK